MFQTKNGVALVVALALLFFAVPRLPVSDDFGMPSLFAYSWLTFACLVIAANFRKVLQLDREKQRQDERMRRERWLESNRRRRTVGSISRYQHRG
ncbi:MAG: hypothetical protein M0Z65_13040 [Firmicutes bacterium]|uniref:Uncharacterized protein n=1 Tax=Melghirimyces thermohalophilus TaxID=1236220 RepID=A0A1G6MJM5_9BACL|nr:hypothetical protein [Melghirimyces thermohalophilus]MDA8354072.1 hypothetical protein [Bacillota bacterium]SDC55733.1 hypothetical protein SAMN04488112_11015 [Melghirimyces thermohalophilus]